MRAVTPALLMGALLGVGWTVAAPAAAYNTKCTFWAELDLRFAPDRSRVGFQGMGVRPGADARLYLTDDDDNGLLEFCMDGEQWGLCIGDALGLEEVGWDR